MNILEKITAHKRKEVAIQKEKVPFAVLEKEVSFSRTCISLVQRLKQPGASGIIAEIKRKSPSQGIIHPNVLVDEIALGYAAAGCSGLSVLTDFEFFGGTSDDLVAARKVVDVPVLRKDFIVDEYQITEAKAIGADVILLIAACLEPEKIKWFTSVAHGLGLEVLLEVHDEAELMSNLDSGADLLGVNNRNLKTFEVSVDVSRRLAEKIPSSFVKISESGIDQVNTVLELREYGYEGFLMGQNFMKHERPEVACRKFVEELRAGK
ncbi:MAG: indole-3-glycerol phosphate synthase TrpC [Cyclobacteriaceae bacterium]|nr:MAG: indole-3-glycerol phosphate synthase TrpC [Cyclobacteriaceae bacterium]